ncbi:MAG: family 43 glycosylhydrolase [Bacteroidales bacterium]|nr:family 43 glycosylhydrolase [Bacteroidales bacterium]
MKKTLPVIIVCLFLCSCSQKQPVIRKRLLTICNPVNLDYRFQPELPSRREAADPTMVFYNGIYYLFASKSGGYWYSSNLAGWTFVETDDIPAEEYAPTVLVMNDNFYFLASSGIKSTIYMSSDPNSGRWEIARDSLAFPVWDPALFLDDDNRLYLFWGCSDKNPVYGIELDVNSFEPITEPVPLIRAHPDTHGWEVPGDYNTRYGNSPWIEGAWLNKINGTYYLQYAGPGTEFKSYCDGIYMSDSPLGPYQPAIHNPFAYKPGGFAAGAGHGSTFTDRYGNYWHIGTITISVKHMFERRLGLYPAFVDKEGLLYAVTKYGDFPMIIPDKKIESFDDIFPGWMLLSYRKKVSVSSSADTLPPDNMTDENIRTYWSALTGSNKEWAIMDLGNSYDVYAIQVNFAEHNSGILGRKDSMAHQYTIEASEDGRHWEMMADKSDNRADNPHDYIRLNQKVSCRYLKIKNKKVPDGNFALSGFRIFGRGEGDKPFAVNWMEATRNPDDRRSVLLRWSGSGNATGYNISYGSDKDKLYHNYIVYQDTSVSINSLNANQAYFFTIESFNENGITKSDVLKMIR